jgi:hypothetical protein
MTWSGSYLAACAVPASATVKVAAHAAANIVLRIGSSWIVCLPSGAIPAGGSDETRKSV